MKALLVEDNREVANALKTALTHAGINVTHEETLAAARRQVKSGQWDILLLDVNLPDGNGIDLCEFAQEHAPETPIIFMTGREDEETAIRGFSAGAVDFVRKPVGHREVLLRIKRALGDRQTLRFGSLTLAIHSRELLIGGKTVKVPPREFEILAALTKRPEQLIPREELLIDQGDSDGDSRAVDGHISRLRGRLKKAGANDIEITSSYGAGYLIKKAS